jgi:hypothetical protein
MRADRLLSILLLLDSYRTMLTGLKESEVQALCLTRP